MPEILAELKACLSDHSLSTSFIYYHYRRPHCVSFYSAIETILKQTNRGA